jgi:hypothetical protein
MASALGSRGALSMKKLRDASGEADFVKSMKPKDFKKFNKNQIKNVKSSIAATKKEKITDKTRTDIRKNIRSAMSKKFADKMIGNNDLLFGKGKGKS